MPRPILFVLAFGLAVVSCLQLVSGWARNAVVSAHGESGSMFAVLPTQRRMDVVERAMRVPFSSADVYVNRAELATTLARRATSSVRREHRECEALTALVEAVKLDPYHGIALVNIAFLGSSLTNARCPTAKLLPDPVSIVDFAVSVCPTWPEVLYSSAFLMHSLGHPQRARSIARRLLSLEVPMPSRSPLELLKLLSNPDELTEIVPAKLQLAVAWSNYLRSEGADRFDLFRSAIEKIQLNAINSDLKTNMLSNDQRILLERMLRVAATSQVRESIDALLASSTGYADQGGFYRERSKLREHEIVRTFINSDSTPARGALLGWNRGRVVALDYYYNSVGFFDPDSEDLRRIDLESTEQPSESISSLLKVFTSSDNVNWADITRKTTLINQRAGDRSVVSILLAKDAGGPFWKVHFAAASRDSRLVGELESFVRAYGQR